MIIRPNRKAPASRRAVRRNITAGTSITSGVQKRTAQTSGKYRQIMASLSPEKRAFANQLQANSRKNRTAITAATNTSNIMVRPDFLELLPLFVQKLLILDVYGSVAMKSRQQLVPYFKFISENTKGETAAGTILSSPFVNRQGTDPNYTSRLVKHEQIIEGTGTTGAVVYTPVLPNSVKITEVVDGVETVITDNGAGALVTAANETVGSINYSNGAITFTTAPGQAATDAVFATYQYDNETVGPDAAGQYGAKMAKGYLMLDEFNLVAEAHEMASYWSLYSAFATQEEYGADIGAIAKEAAFSELTAEINTAGFQKLFEAASFKPQFDWDASPVLSGSVVPSDYLNMFKLKLTQAAASIYQATRLTQPNKLVVGSNAGAYISMMNGFTSEKGEDEVGPYKLGKLDQFDIFVDPSYDPNVWVMACKSNDIRRNSALFGEYMPMTATDPITLANASTQQGYATMYAMKVVNPETVISGRILGTF